MASSIHEAFLLTKDDEDTSDLRNCFFYFLMENDRQIMAAINKNLPTIIKKFVNSHTLDNFKGRTAVADSGSDASPDSKASSVSERVMDSFSSAVLTAKANQASLKRRQTLGITNNSPTKIEIEDSLVPIFAGPDKASEVVYSDLLQRLMIFFGNI